MNVQVINTIAKDFAKDLPDMNVRKAVRVGDTVVAHTKIIVPKKLETSMTTAEKQARKKASDAGKDFDPMANLKSQPFKGVVIAIKGHGMNKKIVVRKIGAHNIGVEKIIPLFTPVLEKLEILSHGKPRQSRLGYLRQRVGKMALRVRERKNVVVPKDAPVAEPVQETPAEELTKIEVEAKPEEKKSEEKKD